MKTIFRIIVILLVASVVAGAFSLAVNNSSTTSSSTENAQSLQPMGRPEGGDRDGGSLIGGFAGIFGTLAKLASILILVLVLQKGFDQIQNFKWKSAHQ